MKKMDEMQMSINLKAIRWSYLFTVIALFLWTAYDFIHFHTISLAFYILVAQHFIYFLVSNIAKWKMGDGDGRKGLLYYVVGMVFFLIVFGVLLFYFNK